MPRRCSHCNQDGHNSRTCPNRGVRLFGVRLSDGSMQKSASTGNLAGFARSAGGGGSHLGEDPSSAEVTGCGYASDGFRGGPATRERKKGVPWTEQEHKMFLLGLRKLGKGDWRGISRKYVMSRTPTQVASHAQKYFIRHSALNRRKKRVSLFDIVADENTLDTLGDNHHLTSMENKAEEAGLQPLLHRVSNDQSELEADTSTTGSTVKYGYPPPAYPILLPLPLLQGPSENADMKENSTTEAEKSATLPPSAMPHGFPFVYSSLLAPGFTCPMPYWSTHAMPSSAMLHSHGIVKPMAVQPKPPIDENFGMSRLSLGACNGEAGPSSEATNLAGSSGRPSAFHARGTTGGSKLDSSSSPIHAL
ncbi:hypothetical protein HPP92_028251 [Vanilla planifolia]|uniref:Uncharacterized protein n=1 Tax=Vanilla planifolia TaxID=51239 RepID=A0A835P9D7_VANPL|nr:hypothetical protein HPP92_028251 [Vanilla planifolia]